MQEISAKELDSRVRKQFENARIAIDRGNFEYAVELCAAILVHEPGCLEVRRLLRHAQQCVFANRGQGFGRKLFRKAASGALVAYGGGYVKKKPAFAMEQGERALFFSPFSKGALSLVAAGAERLELFHTAAFCLSAICEANPEDFEHLKRYCEALIKTGETTQAVSLAERLSRLKPENAPIQELVKSASVAHSINKGKWAEEEQDFRSKLKDSDLADALERESRLVGDKEGGNAQAKALIEDIQRDPQNLDLYKRLVRGYVDASDYANAILWLDKASLLPQAEADLILTQTRSEVAIKATERELQQLRDEAESHPEKARANAKRIRILEREFASLQLEETRKMVEQFPNDYAQRLKYGELLLNAGRLDEAIKQFQVSQRSTSLRHQSCVLLGRSFFEKRLYDLALEQFDRSIEGVVSMDEFKKEVLYASAQCCEKLKKGEEAVRRYKLIYASDIGFRDVARKIETAYTPDQD